MIRFHYHAAAKNIPRLRIAKGDPLCHVYSDRSLPELVAWGREHGLRPEWIHRHSSMPHFDAFGEHLAHCGEGISRRELVADIRRWRQRRVGQAGQTPRDEAQAGHAERRAGDAEPGAGHAEPASESVLRPPPGS